MKIFVLQRLVKVSSLLKSLQEVELLGTAFQMGPILITISVTFLFIFKGTQKCSHQDCVDRQMFKTTCFVVRVTALFSNQMCFIGLLTFFISFCSPTNAHCVPKKEARKTAFAKCCA